MVQRWEGSVRRTPYGVGSLDDIRDGCEGMYSTGVACMDTRSSRGPMPACCRAGVLAAAANVR